MKTAEKRVALYVVQYRGTWGWEPLHNCVFRLRKSAVVYMRDCRERRCMNRDEEKKFRVVRYMPEAR